MKYRIIYIACLLSIIALSGQAQQETWTWTFGDGAGLTWNNICTLNGQGVYGTTENSPLIMPIQARSGMKTKEGCFTISDPQGNLLCYSDGSKVWDRTHAIMPGGEAGNFSGDEDSAQSGIFFPYPGSSSKYVMITISPYSDNIMMYGIIDMNPATNGGHENGAVTSTGTFSGQTGKLGESVSAIRHSNGSDYWVVAPGTGTGTTAFNAWRVTSSGVQATSPVKSTLPINIKSFTDGGTYGYVKFSKDSRTILWGSGYATITGGYGCFFLGDFNPSTGSVTNIKYRTLKKTITPTPMVHQPVYFYSAEFSPSGKYLYTTSNGVAIYSSSQDYWGLMEVFDFEELKNDPENAIPKASYTSNMYMGAAQLTPDGRIFISENKEGLDIIENPDEAENLRIYHISNTSLFSDYISARAALPNFLANYFYDSNLIGNRHFCLNTNQLFILNITNTGIDLSYTKWDFGDGSSIETGGSSLMQSKPHIYTESGSYTISVKCYDANDTEIPHGSKTLQIYVDHCSMPVNPNIHLY
ncbi:hypothetical protein M2459_003506 [Parabacteroides sp. PF5-5]|uniref:PKD domain-containing protein n=1 Tax=unclassified Parabacteroides TaxID=2649774 RepID=UPI002477151A|nr:MULTISPECIES: PKD domain-containing protein [unclassified Parabacteroides]MDH6317745.1 hypothetical protein [Parabacteroides sp. PF5-13]MDH6328930.1 hypothetical protein [Parabacteroides sp. PH5-41]MDH6336732.1 hypothetical protein [Parabacteroides sp. PF5-5]MDH6347750.1 hypothetical protein [Parabacteroides sp. PH5-46]MDH6362710.1 hypothetical protein [Parabacteroides sp. PH5-16]